MKKINKHVNWMMVAVLVISVALITGCTSYYRVKDTASDKTYYTTQIDRQSSGSVRFVDENSDSVVTLQNSSIKEIDSDEFKANTKKK